MHFPVNVVSSFLSPPLFAPGNFFLFSFTPSFSLFVSQNDAFPRNGRERRQKVAVEYPRERKTKQRKAKKKTPKLGAFFPKKSRAPLRKLWSFSHSHDIFQSQRQRCKLPFMLSYVCVLHDSFPFSLFLFLFIYRLTYHLRLFL